MSGSTSIEWTDATWNPLRGCTHVSAGCKNCYAEAFAERFRGVAGHPYEHGFDLRLVPGKLLDPLRWSKPRSVFVNSMSDLMHRDVPVGLVEVVAEVMRLADWHTYQLLTKRAGLLRAMSHRVRLDHPNVVLGVSVEDKRSGVPRIAELRETRAHKRMLSIEPLLEDLGDLDLTGIDWVIVGGESGPGCRPMAVGWARRIRDLCVEQRVPFHFKQHGGFPKAVLGRKLDGETYDARLELDRAPVPSARDRSSRMRQAEGHPWLRATALLEQRGTLRVPMTELGTTIGEAHPQLVTLRKDSGAGMHECGVSR